jgi:hypothetical protein
MMFGTDPVAIDRLLLDVIENQRKAEGAISVWDRSPESLVSDANAVLVTEPNRNRYIREPGHIEFAARFGLGEYDIRKIRVQRIEL